LTPERWRQISRIFKSAVSLDPDARASYVSGQCAGDDSLREEVEKLIESHQKAGSEDFIDGIAVEDGAELLVPDDENEQQTSGLKKGQQFGSYLIIDTLGEGGMGEVYLAKDTRLERTVALKILSADVSGDQRRMQRFSQEARVASSLNQPNILTIFEFGEADSRHFLATEYIDGETLRDYKRLRQLKLPEIIDISIQIVAALDAAHEANIVHRDIKPENVMIRRRDNVVKVLDFGLAKLTEKGATLKSQATDTEAATAFKTAPGSIMGTINYMSPEQAQGLAVDQRTDIWSTGVIIYEMVAGEMPFKGATSSHTIVQILEKEPAALMRVGQVRLPAELQRIVGKAMAKNAGERYQTAKDLLIDLRNLKKRLDVEAEIGRTSAESQRAFVATSQNPAVASEPVVEPRSTEADESQSAPQKKRVLAIALIGMALVVTAVFGINAWRSSRARTASISAVPSAPVAVVERTLTYWITVQKFKDKKPYQDPFILAGEINFEPDYQIRINVRSPQPGQLYVLNEGPGAQSEQPEFVVVFPSPTANQGTALLAAGQSIQFPEQTWLKFDEQQGVEKLWVVFAEDPIPELEAVKTFVNRKDKGLITDLGQNKLVQNFLGSHSDAKLAYEKSETLTTLKSPGKILVYAIKLEHH
jgi:serine/threonine protein kinase